MLRDRILPNLPPFMGGGIAGGQDTKRASEKTGRKMGSRAAGRLAPRSTQAARMSSLARYLAEEV